MSVTVNNRSLYLIGFWQVFTWPIDKGLEEKGLVVISGNSLKSTMITEAGRRYINSLSFSDILTAYKTFDNRIYNLATDSFLIYAKRAMSRLSRADLCEYLASDIKWVREIAKRVYDSI